MFEMFHTRICDLLGIRYPILQGALGGVSGGPRLAAGVSNAGGLGVLASYGLSDRELREEIHQTRALTDRPFGLNIYAARPAFVERVAKTAVEEGVTIVTTGRGDPRQLIVSLLKEHGITVLPVVAAVRHAVRMEEEGADAVIASGMEAGGHVGVVCSLPLIPQVVSAVGIPVVAAGGIGDARGFVAALALGACGIQMGTRFLASNESGANEEQKRRIVEASEEDTVATPVFTGRNVRVIKSPEVEHWFRRQRDGATLEELEDLANEIRRRRTKGSSISVTAGQVSGMIVSVESVADIMRAMLEEATQICRGLGALTGDQ
ncbi:MAG: nitronate monooxygenase [Chloroflexota bacterium]|nr:nitronate monooxygenase [Chloroflexota bacterium]